MRAIEADANAAAHFLLINAEEAATSVDDDVSDLQSAAGQE